MPKNQLSFYSTPEDIRFILRAVESMVEVQFIPMGLFDTSTHVAVPSLAASANLGIALTGDSNREQSYLVAPINCMVETRAIPQRGGGTKYAIDQLANPSSIVLRPGGIFGDAAVVAGQVGTASVDVVSSDLFATFSMEIQRQFRKVRSFYVGAEACQLLDNGWRLTSNIKSPSTYDLRRK